MYKCRIVIPCYNEAERLLPEEFNAFIDKNENFSILFVNDGSVDHTREVLEQLSRRNDRIQHISLPENKGKAEAVRSGIIESLKSTDFKYLAYLDADLAIPLEEFKRLYKITLEHSEYEFTFLSKIPHKNGEVKQSFKRFFIGRVLAFMNKMSLKLPVYDTQCGCKIMTRETASYTFSEPFISGWLFDIEIFWRILNHKGREYYNAHTLEVPLERLVDRGSSTISRKAIFKLPLEFLKIHRTYKNRASK